MDGPSDGSVTWTCSDALRYPSWTETGQRNLKPLALYLDNDPSGILVWGKFGSSNAVFPMISPALSCSKAEFAPVLACVLSVLLFACRASAQTTTPVAHWSFDEADGNTAHDSIGHANGKITGVYKHVNGALSNGLRLDGDTSGVTVAAADTPHLKGSFIDSFGHLGFQLSANGVWQSLISQERLPLKRWSHVAATFDESKGMTLYIDGTAAGEIKVQPPFTFAGDAELLIGRVRQPLLPAQWIHPKYPVWYSFDGILDEIKITDGALSPDEIAGENARIHPPAGDALPYPALPSGAPGAGPFGAFYATLKYEELWDAPRRVGPDSDVVVRFDQSPIRLVSWQGTNYVPAWVTDNGKWYSDEFVETGGLPGCPDGEDCEPMLFLDAGNSRWV
jgi:hypothetical protein